jgi:cell fate (sporulation/competence/biofilm development) regulator YlbF (YheA/YmcA/DUF963 family)
MSENIEDLAKSLGAEIEELTEYNEYLDAVEKYDNNTEAQEKLSELRWLENEIIAAHERDEPHSEHKEKHAEYEQLSEELAELDVVSSYYDTVEELEERLSDINDDISEGLKLNFAYSVE